MNFTTAFLVAALVIGLLSLNEFQAKVVENQKQLIRQMMTDPACTVQR